MARMVRRGQLLSITRVRGNEGSGLFEVPLGHEFLELRRRLDRILNVHGGAALSLYIVAGTGCVCVQG